MTIAVGDKVPEATFSYISYAPELDDLVRLSLSRSSTHTPNRASLSVEPVRAIAKPTPHKNLTADSQSLPTPSPKSGLERRSWCLLFPARSPCATDSFDLQLN